MREGLHGPLVILGRAEVVTIEEVLVTSERLQVHSRRFYHPNVRFMKSVPQERSSPLQVVIRP